MKISLKKTEKVAVYTPKRIWQELVRNRYLYLLMLPAVLYLIFIHYRTMYGLLLAFKDFNAGLGITGSPWVGLKHFRGMFTDTYFIHVLFNTIFISFGQIIVTFPFPVIIAICFNELRGRLLKRTLQTVYTFPHFLSWVVVSGIIINFLSYTGPLNSIVSALGGERHTFLGDRNLIIPILYITQIWKEAGWSSIIYLAAIVGINAEFYEAADLDGASRWQKIWHITLPSIRGTILVMLILRVGGILNGNFDQIFNLTNTVVQKTVDILDTYIYRITFQQTPNYAYSTAIGLFKNAVGFLMVMIVNKISKKLEGTGILD